MRKTTLSLVLMGALAVPLVHAQTPDLVTIAGIRSVEQLQAALKRGADPNARDSAGRTILMIAAASNQDEKVIALLVSAGAKVNARGPAGWTALMMAAYDNPNPAVVLALLKAGADGKIRSDAGHTAFEYAQDNEKVIASPAYAVLKKSQN
jgi:ankyrin repeat protein